MLEPTLIGLVAAAGAVLGAMVAWRKAGVESESVAVGTLRVVIAELRTELDRKDEELAGMRQRVDELEGLVDKLVVDPPGHLG